jgi:hypothetical protein
MWVHFTSDLSQELVIVYFIVSVAVKFLEKFFTFGRGNFNSEIA